MTFIRFPWVALLAVGMQFLSVYQLRSLSSVVEWHRIVLVVSYVLLAIVVAANWRLWGIRILGLALALNLSAIAINGGLMPVTPESVMASGKGHRLEGVALGEPMPNSKDVLLERENTRLWMLTDIFSVATPIARKSFSIGDVLVLVGLAVTTGEVLYHFRKAGGAA